MNVTDPTRCVECGALIYRKPEVGRWEWRNYSDGELHTCNDSDTKGETMERDLRSIRNEADYWKAIAEDMQAVLDGIGAVTDKLTEIPTSTLTLLAGGQDPLAYAAQVNAIAVETLKQLFPVLETIRRVSELVGGRIIVLTREAGLDTEAGAS